MSQYTAIGLMSGSSLDGIDIALAQLTHDQGRYGYRILDAVTQPYPAEWQQKLTDAFLSTPEALQPLHEEYGDYLGRCVKTFIEERHLHPDFVASHGHTVFHRPELGYTLQIGDGQALADR